jgi:hypothetical protein
MVHEYKYWAKGLIPGPSDKKQRYVEIKQIPSKMGGKTT